MKKHNFFAGPSILPDFTVERTAEAIKNFNGIGLSLMEVSHRSKDFQAVIDETVALFKELLRIPEGYSVVFVGGGASLQFAMVPYNMLEKKAAYLNTGEWATKAIKEAKLFGEVVTVGSSEDKLFNYIPRGYEVPADADYFHVTTNNTIYGTELFEDFDFGVPLVADMSSDILSRPIDVSKYALIYGGAQKNLGPAGVTFVIVKDDAVGKVSRKIPTMLNYKTHIDKGSMFNTPPVVPIFACLQTLKWLKDLGGVEVIEKKNIEKSNKLYGEIDRNPLFKPTIPNPADRSRMNVCFVMDEPYKHLEPAFQEFASARGMVGIKGHRSVGGFRASLYNALPMSSVDALIETMQEFTKQNS
jgi:phosphoserine aminotransferase